MKIQIEITGKGGQGIQILSKIIRMAIEISGESLHLAIAQSYDAMVRGGISDGHIIISDEKILNPVLENPDITVDLVNKKIVRKNCKDIIQIPPDILDGAPKYHGVVLIGIMIKIEKNFFNKDFIKKAIGELFREDAVARGKNLEALRLGIDIGEEYIEKNK